jgi:SP family general alpha glucoside:H+ symporter-like MFS transporter
MSTTLKHNGEPFDGDAIDVKGLSAAAKADDQEHSNTIWQAFLIHKKAVFWSMALSGAYVHTYNTVAKC